MQFRPRTKIMAAFGILLVAAMAWLAVLEPPKGVDFRADVAANKVFGQLISVLPTALRDAMSKGEFTVDDLTKLDFSLPGDPGFDITSQYSVLRMLHANGTGISSKASLYGKNDVFVAQSDLDLLTTRKGLRLLFNVRQFRRPDGIISQPALYIILPNYRDRVPDNPTPPCFRGGDNDVYKAPLDFVIGADNHHIIQDSEEIIEGRGSGTCVLMSNGDSHMFFKVNFQEK